MIPEHHLIIINSLKYSHKCFQESLSEMRNSGRDLLKFLKKSDLILF